MPRSNPDRYQRRAWMAALIVLTVLAGTLVWQRSRFTRASAYVAGNPDKGAALFFGKKQCATCHSINGSGGAVAPDLSQTHPGTPGMGWLTAVLWNHAPGMFRQMRHGNVGYPQLDAQEMAHVLAFLYREASRGRRGNPESGERVFQEKGCSHCHSVRASGAHAAPDLSAVSANTSIWTGAMWNHAQAMLHPLTKALGRWPQFTGEEMNDLVTYAGAAGKSADAKVSPGDAGRGRQVFERKCAECHSVRGQGGSVGPELGPDREMPLGEADFAAVLWNHAPAMLRKMGGSSLLLQAGEVADLHAFLVSLRYFEPSGSALDGERAFTERGCAHCHGPAAQGTKLGPQLRAGAEPFTGVSFTTALWRHGPHMLDRAEETGVEWPVLQPADIGDLVSFLNEPARK
ncbi:MAG TPA: c-type cytochrome [Bryobacteraceae bacterium]|nr:c-type cytochrome [Bryobacteraceae bacterium]